VYETAIVRLCGWGAGRPTVGLGLLVGPEHVVTCAHVVNNALGRDQLEQAPPGESDRVQVEFPLLPETPVRLARIVRSAWTPPAQSGAGGRDIAGLVLTEKAPGGTAPARFTAAAKPEPGTQLRVFGYPGRPLRETGAWVDVDLKGEVGGRVIQVESKGDQTIRAQPGFSGSPVWDHRTGEAVGLMQVAPVAGEPARDAYLLGPLAVAEAWEEQFDYLLVPGNPYRGLEPFTADQASVFFGRDADTLALTALVNAQPAVVIVGPSGVGKSSLVQAGLIPALQHHHRWSIALVRPGRDPWLRLAAALLRAQDGLGAPVTMEQSWREADRLRAKGIVPVAQFLRSENRPLLVLVDQFEELLATDERPDQDFLDLLLPPPDVAHIYRLVLTLRADFLPVLQSIPGFHTRLNERLYLLSPLTAEQTREAVERPAATRGVAFEPGLVDQILSDATGGALPLLEFTLTKLWETQRHKTLTFAGYQQMGGVRGALDIFAEQRTAEIADTVGDHLDRVLLRLVRISGSGRDLAVRQRILRSEVSDTEWEVLQRLAAARLVVLDAVLADSEPYAELAHESLITAWQHLHNLVAKNAEFLSWRSRMEIRALEGDFLPEARIAEARNWLDARPGDVPVEVRRFIQNSQAETELRLRELREARDRAQAAEAAAERARSRRRRGKASEAAADVADVMQVTLSDALDPIVRSLGRAVTATDRHQQEALQEGTVAMVVDSAAHLVGSGRVRACLFRFAPGTPRTLAPSQYSGRVDDPLEPITEGTTEGDLVFSMIRRNQHLFCPDLDADHPHGWRVTAAQGYKSFAAVPVAAGQNAFGMLMVDTLDKGGIRRVDVPMIKLLAGLLAVAFA
jgi:V8-like Glu-specific endopeptidase